MQGNLTDAEKIENEIICKRRNVWFIFENTMNSESEGTSWRQTIEGQDEKKLHGICEVTSYALRNLKREKSPFVWDK
jgi:hypothetical protein